MSGATHLYAIAIGSNRAHGRYGRPTGVVEAAIGRLDQDFGLFDAAPILINPAHGAVGRDFANSVALIESDLDPPALLKCLKGMERDFAAGAGAAGARAFLTSTSSHGAAANGRATDSPFRTGRPSAAASSSGRWRRSHPAGRSTATSPRIISPIALPAAVRAGNGAPLVGPIAQSVEQLTFNQ